MGNTVATSSSSDFDLPKNYIYVKELGHGTYGKVLKCVKCDSRETVAVKIPRRPTSHCIYCEYCNKQEASIMQELMRHGLDEKNIIKFYEQVPVVGVEALVLELLDFNLLNFMKQRRSIPLEINHIRTIIQQMATALDALEKIGLIHTDVKPKNIMLVDHVRQPFRVKLVDFSSAIWRSEARPGSNLQPIGYRSPEIILGLQFCESIDMWSLGCVLGFLLTGCRLFPGTILYDTLHFMVDLLGPPPDHLLNAGLKTELYFEMTDDQNWRFKKPGEYLGQSNYSRVRASNIKRKSFHCLDDLKRLRSGSESEIEDRSQCVDLLKAMLQMDPADRIRPTQVLSHAFITTTDPSNSSTSSEEPTEEPGSLRKIFNRILCCF